MADASFESKLSSYINTLNAEKTFIDKTLAKDDATEIKNIMRKPELSRSDMLNLLYLLSGNEQKLLNYGHFDRYLLAKFLTWIRGFVSCGEVFYDIQEELEAEEKELFNQITLSKSKQKKTETTALADNLEEIRICKEIIDEIIKKNSHDTKFLVDIFLFLGRSTLSLGNTGFDTLTSNRFEYAYPQMATTQPVQEKKGIFNFNLGRK